MSKINVIEKSRGRYFGLSTKQGGTMNARFIGSTDKYIRVYDRNDKREVKLAKASVDTVNYGGQTFR